MPHEHDGVAAGADVIAVAGYDIHASRTLRHGRTPVTGVPLVHDGYHGGENDEARERVAAATPSRRMATARVAARAQKTTALSPNAGRAGGCSSAVNGGGRCDLKCVTGKRVTDGLASAFTNSAWQHANQVDKHAACVRRVVGLQLLFVWGGARRVILYQ